MILVLDSYGFTIGYNVCRLWRPLDKIIDGFTIGYNVGRLWRLLEIINRISTKTIVQLIVAQLI
jgi:hypothetical protein